MDAELLEKAKRYGINLSRLMERAIREEIMRYERGSDDDNILPAVRKLADVLPDPNLIPFEVAREYAKRLGVAPHTVMTLVRSLTVALDSEIYNRFLSAIELIIASLESPSLRLNIDAMAEDLYGGREDKLVLLTDLYDLVARHKESFKRLIRKERSFHQT